MSPTDKAKQLAGYKAVDDHVTSGMVVGLGTGSTAYFAVERVGQKLASGELKDIICIPTSERTRQQAESLKIPLCTLNEKSQLDVAIDGADAVDPNLALVKGGGGALLREKMVEVMSKKFICIVDDSKLCKGLGPSFPLPVEITPFCHLHTLRTIATLPEVAGAKAVLRLGDVSNNKPDGDKPAVTDNGNYIVDLIFDSPIKDVRAAAKALKGVSRRTAPHRRCSCRHHHRRPMISKHLHCVLGRYAVGIGIDTALHLNRTGRLKESPATLPLPVLIAALCR
jgi:ribose 5-phosphate isomerase A